MESDPYMRKPATTALIASFLALYSPVANSRSTVADDAVTASGIVAWPAPAGEALCEFYSLAVNGQPVAVHACRVSAMPFNQVWPGYQRPLDQTELAAFACWDMAGPVTVEVTSERAVNSAVVRPAALNISPEVTGHRVSFRLERPTSLVVEINGAAHALHLFASPPETEVPPADTAGLRYFGPGVHHPGRITLQDNEAVYIAGGAVVHGSIHAHGASNIRISGRGILDVSQYERGVGGGAICLADCRDITIEGIVMRDPDVWCCSLFGCQDATISGVKLIGLWRYNADGIDVCNSENVTVEDCFVRAFDDALVIKGLKSARNSFDDRPIRNVRFRRCVVWCDWGRAMEIGAETCSPEIADIVFEDCDIIRTTHIALDIQHGDRALIRDILFENIRVEIDPWNPRPRMQSQREEQYQSDPSDTYCPVLIEIVIRPTPYSKDDRRGTVRDVAFRNIHVVGPHRPHSSLRGFDAEHDVVGVTFQNLRFNDVLARDAEAARLHIGPHVTGIQVLAP